MSLHVPFLKSVFVVVMLLITGIVSFGQMSTPVPYSGNKPVSYVRTWNAKGPQIDGAKLKASASLDSFITTTQYVDGLGRPLQLVAKQQSPLGKDVVTANVYDESGREQFRYLPFVANVTGGNTSITDGLFKLNPFHQDSVFYRSADMASPLTGQGQTYLYSQTQFENSPLSRQTKTLAAGNNWVGSSRGIEFKYEQNSVSDSVRIWMVTNASIIGSWGSYLSDSMYKAGTLERNITIDEAGNKVVEYKDNEGKTVLKKVQLSAIPSTGHSGWLCTYYMYDENQQLRCVVQPRGVQLLQSNNWNINALSGAILNEQCFRYEYDAEGQMIVKKVPGAGRVFMVYDARGRIAMTQDSLQRTGTAKWLVTFYDGLNRPIQTGLLNNSSISNRTIDQHWSTATNQVDYPFSVYTNPGTGYEELTRTGYDHYDSLPTGAQNGVLKTTYINSSNFEVAYNVSPVFAQVIEQSLAVKGMVTWQKVKVLASSPATYLYTTTIYDGKGRPIQIKSTNISGGVDVVTNQYSFSGQLIRTHLEHQKSGAAANIYQTLTINSYDHAGRLLKVSKKVNATGTNNTTAKVIVENTYDELGQLKTKKIGSNPLVTTTPLETQTYDYNIRGWVLGANRSYVKSIDSISSTTYFGFDLGYDQTSFIVGSTNTTYTLPQYNGNIGGMLWKSTGDDKIRKYDFSYDAVSRLTGAAFTQFHSNAFNTTAGIDYSVSNLTYDANGNILTNNQKGWKLGGSVMIDALQYNYLSNSNKLLNVIDNNNDTATRLGDFRSSKMYMTAIGGTKTATATDYTYDANGNLKKDRNKDIGTSGSSGIAYNHLNLPTQITVQGKGTIDFVYDARGNKLKKIVTDTTTNPDKVTTTLYMAGVYENDSLQYLGHEEGRIRYNSSAKIFNWDYFIKDHLGNVRIVLTEEQKTTAYPAATMEDALASTEQALYANLPETRSSLPGGYPLDNSYSDPNLKAAKVNGNGQKIGPSITLKVMAGDKFNVKVSSWYRTVSGVPQTTSSPLTQLINAISTSVAPISAGKVTSPELSGSSFFAAEATKFLQTQNNVATKPKAYLNWILFDEQFNMVAASSGFEQVPEESMYSNTTTPKVYNHIKTNLPVHKNGYLYIYVSNETQGLDVFFDNLQVTHVAGPMVEETHYYPFGLTMAGVSSKGFDKLESKNKYNGIELSEDLGIDIYDAQLRELDPQIGRWWQIDPETESMEMWSTYSSNYDNPIRYQDPLGNAPEGCCKGFIDGLKKLGNDVYDAAVYDVKLVNTYFNPLTPAAELVTGKSVESNFTESKSRVESGTELLISLVPGGKVEGSVMRLAQKKIIRKAPSAIANEVGTGKKSNSNNSTNNNNFPSPDFIVDEKGNALPIPDGASGPKNPNKGSGMLYEGGSGGKGMSKKTTGVRVMDPNKKRKTREVNYMNKQGQTVNSKTGKTVAKSDPNAHIPY